MKKVLKNNEIIQNDISRYKKNSLASTFALLGIAFNCLYFMIMYAQQCGNIQAKYTADYGGGYVYTWINGASVVVNLAVLLFTFLSSEKIKNYQWKFSIMLWVIAAIQIGRIFVYPLISVSQEYRKGLSSSPVISGVTFTILLVCLCLSAACLIYAGYVGLVRAKKLNNFLKDVEDGKIDLEGALKEGDALAGDIPELMAEETAEVSEAPAVEAAGEAEAPAEVQQEVDE